MIEHVVDKSGWLDGPWKNEPDRVEWRSPTGFVCLIVRAYDGEFIIGGHLCGYVGVPPGHPWHGRSHHEIVAAVHGGVDYAEACQGVICHVPQAGEPEELWWVGFDCAHFADFSPGSETWMCQHIPDRKARTFGVYKDVAWVTAETEYLAEQAHEAMS